MSEVLEPTSGRRKRRFLTRAHCLAGVGVVCLFAGRARAEESAFCSKVRARARSEAALLQSPSVGVQAVRVPKQGDAEAASTPGPQVRVYASYSLVDAYKGHLTEQAAEADCIRQEAQTKLADALVTGLDAGKLPAIERQLEYLARALLEGRQLVSQARERFDRKLTTLAQYNEIRALQLALERLRVETASEAERLRITEPANSGVLEPLARRYSSATQDFESSTSRVRRMAPWDLSVRGGVVPVPERDYFGVVELRYNLGDVVQAHAESDYLAARSRELQDSKQEMVLAASQVDAQLRASVRLLTEELALLENENEIMQQQIEALRASETAEREHLLAVARLRQMSLEAEAAYCRELLRQRSPWQHTTTQSAKPSTTPAATTNAKPTEVPGGN